MRGRVIKAAGEAGFTVIEVVVATAILLTVVTAAMGGIMFSSTSTMMTENRSEALTLANNQVELARNLPFDEVATVVPSNGLPSGKIPSPVVNGDYTIVTSVGYGTYGASSASRYKTISTTVSWTKPRVGSVTVSSLISGASGTQDYNFGTIVFKVVDEASPANPVVGVTVDMTDVHNKVYRGVTDTSGTVTFQYVPSGDVDFTGNKPGMYVDAITGTCYANQVSSPPITTVAHSYRTGIISVMSENGNPAPAGIQVALSGGPNTPSPTTLVTGDDGKVTFVGLIKGTYNIAVTDSAARFKAQAAGTPNKLTVGTSDASMNLIVYANSVTVNVTLTAKGTVYCFNADHTLNTSKATATTSPFKATITLTNKDAEPTTYYFQKTTPWSSSAVAQPITAGTTPVNLTR